MAQQDAASLDTLGRGFVRSKLHALQALRKPICYKEASHVDERSWSDFAWGQVQSWLHDLSTSTEAVLNWKLSLDKGTVPGQVATTEKPERRPEETSEPSTALWELELSGVRLTSEDDAAHNSATAKCVEAGSSRRTVEVARFDFNDILHYRLLHTMYSKLARCKAELCREALDWGTVKERDGCSRFVRESAAIGRL